MCSGRIVQNPPHGHRVHHRQQPQRSSLRVRAGEGLPGEGHRGPGRRAQCHSRRRCQLRQPRQERGSWRPEKRPLSQVKRMFILLMSRRAVALPQVSLKTHRTKAGLIKAVTKIEPLSTGTMTGLAIQFALNVAFSEGEGARVKSPDITKVRCTSGRGKRHQWS